MSYIPRAHPGKYDGLPEDRYMGCCAFCDESDRILEQLRLADDLAKTVKKYLRFGYDETDESKMIVALEAYEQSRKQGGERGWV